MKKKFLIVGIVCILTGLLLGTCTLGCQSTETLSGLKDLGDGNELKISTEQSSNNPWPWMLVVIANNLMWIGGVAGFLYLSKSWIRWGRKDS